MTISDRIALQAARVTFADPRARTATTALDGVELSVGDGEFVCLLGPSGCGKSTALNLLAGFLRPDSGRALVAGQSVEGPGPDRGVVFQDSNVFPWLSVWDNVTFGPRMRRVRRDDYEPRARRYLSAVGLAGFEQHLPKELSGGMQQRVAIARVLVNEPDVLLMDEPFGALDAQTRMLMQELVLDLWERERKTVLFITHDIEEAVLLADRIYVMTARPGSIKQIIDVHLPRPRTYEATASAPFGDYKRQVLHLIREESVRAEMLAS